MSTPGFTTCNRRTNLPNTLHSPTTTNRTTPCRDNSRVRVDRNRQDWTQLHASRQIMDQQLQTTRRRQVLQTNSTHIPHQYDRHLRQQNNQR
ncbi:hypothetical protein QLX08_005889 [Tetragonisca angustula]|uniref:Uncharacterized protein n=1 Tax=Tetragonisca angustula TaxID=166442 RepID=A0AAW0ZWS2_9HYME